MRTGAISDLLAFPARADDQLRFAPRVAELVGEGEHVPMWLVSAWWIFAAWRRRFLLRRRLGPQSFTEGLLAGPRTT